MPSTPEVAAAPRLVPITLAAPVFRISRERLLRRVQAGTIAGTCLGGRWFIDQSEIDRFLAAQSK